MTTAKHPRNRVLTAEETVVNTGGTQLKQANDRHMAQVGLQTSAHELKRLHRCNLILGLTTRLHVGETKDKQMLQKAV